MGLAFLWAPLRFLVVGETIGTFLRGGRGFGSDAVPFGPVAARAFTWIVSCTVSGMLLSLVAIALGYEGG